jgi:hypothetical protein
MTTRKENLRLPPRTPAYVDRETGAAEFCVSPETWDRWEKEGRLPSPAPGFPPSEVLAMLADSALEAELGLSTPSTSRRGHVAELPSGLFSHFCAECGAWGAFGYGVNLRAGRLGRWYCATHRPQGAGP